MESGFSFDIICIGDTVVDDFIRLSLGHVQESANGTELCLPYGKKVPFESSTICYAVGNSANASVSASRLGLKSTLISFLGNDENGKKCLEKLESEKVDTGLIKIEDGKSTNYHYVLWQGSDRTILIKHTPFKRTLPEIPVAKWLYLSSLGEDTFTLHEEIVKYLEKNPGVKLAFQPGTYQLGFKKKIDSVYKHTEVICMNKDEAKELLDLEDDSIKTLLNSLESLGPKITLITDGVNGSYMKYNGNCFSIPIYPDIAPPFERTGAGDAMFSTFVSYLAKGLTPEEAVLRASINAMNVVQKIGAQEGLLNEKEIDDYFKKAPENYTAVKM